MGTKIRILGADAELRGLTETAYGVPLTTGYRKLVIGSTELDSATPLGYDPLLGQGRDGLDPFYEATDVDGDIRVPIDLQYFGFWLHKLCGGTDPATNTGASGDIYFSALPVAGSTITLNGTVWTFVTSGATGPQTNIGVSVSATLSTLVTNLNASADAEVAKVTYTSTSTSLIMVFDTPGVTGNTYTIAASGTSNGRVSNATLWGGGYNHVWTAGGTVPSFTFEVGQPQLTVPVYHRFFGCMAGTLQFDMARTGAPNATINVIAQGKSSFGTTVDAAATAYTLTRFSQGRGNIRIGGAQVANILSGTFNFTNNLDKVETIRSDGLIDGVDALEARSTGNVVVRAGIDTTLTSAVSAQTPVAMEYIFSLPVGWLFKVTLPRVFLPKPKQVIAGPAGVDMTFDWQSAKDATATYNTRFTLVNDLSAAYA